MSTPPFVWEVIESYIETKRKELEEQKEKEN